MNGKELNEEINTPLLTYAQARKLYQKKNQIKLITSVILTNFIIILIFKYPQSQPLTVDQNIPAYHLTIDLPCKNFLASSEEKRRVSIYTSNGLRLIDDAYLHPNNKDKLSSIQEEMLNALCTLEIAEKDLEIISRVQEKQYLIYPYSANYQPVSQPIKRKEYEIIF